MSKKLPIPENRSNIIRPITHISFWEKGEMAYTAIKKINEHKANHEIDKAEIMLSDWIL